MFKSVWKDLIQIKISSPFFTVITVQASPLYNANAHFIGLGLIRNEELITEKRCLLTATRAVIVKGIK